MEENRSDGEKICAKGAGTGNTGNRSVLSACDKREKEFSVPQRISKTEKGNPIFFRNKRSPGFAMRNKPLFFLSVILLFLHPGVFPPDASAQDGKAFFWTVPSERGTVYLLGSIHLLKKEHYPLNPKIESAFEKCNFLVVEADIQGQKNVNQQAILANAFYSPPDNIAKHVSAETYALLQTEANKLGLPMEIINVQKPWFLSMALEAMELMKLGYDPNQGVDNYFLSRARGKTILELENVDEQLGLLSNLSDPEQQLLLLLTLKDLQNVAQEIGPLVRSWQTGDTQKMESIIAKTPRDDPRLKPIYEKLLTDRNLKMLSKIEGYLKERGAYFVVVGAGHLIGSRGIVGLLREKGYRVEQLGEENKR